MSNGVGYRLTKLTYEQTDIGQKKYWNSILSSPRGNSAIDNQGHLAGPFDLFLRSPKTGTVVTSVGEHLRFGTNLSQHVLELAIVIVAAHWVILPFCKDLGSRNVKQPWPTAAWV
jgi:4-carboxymuconolactone decarboxylase